MIPKKLRWQNITPLNEHILITIEQEEEITKGSIILTQHYKPKNHFRILRCAADCEPHFEVNDLILLNRLNRAKQNTYEVNAAERVYLVPQKEVFAIMKQGRLRPTGRNLLMKRFNGDEFDGVSKIVKPGKTPSKDQSLEGRVVELGLGHDFQPIEIGDHVEIQQWDMALVELDYAGDYHLIVPEKLLSHITFNAGALYE